VCELTGTVLPCTEQGILNAVAAGGGPYTFDCPGPRTVELGRGYDGSIEIRKDVILDGEGRLTIDGTGETIRVIDVPEGVSAELRGLTLSGAGCVNGEAGRDICGIGRGVSNAGTLTLLDVSVSKNEVGISNVGVLTVVRSSVSENSLEGVVSAGDGNALTIINSTFSSNGGGLVVEDTMATIGSSVFFRNSPAIGRLNDDSNFTIFVANSLFADSCAPGVNSNGYNIQSLHDNCGFDQPTDRVNVSEDDLRLGPLQDNSGPTETHALGEGSVAIDVTPAEDCVDEEGEPLTTDQRGKPRPAGDGCDAGAFEVQP
jgi:hypothetical protein